MTHNPRVVNHGRNHAGALWTALDKVVLARGEEISIPEQETERRTPLLTQRELVQKMLEQMKRRMKKGAKRETYKDDTKGNDVM